MDDFDLTASLNILCLHISQIPLFLLEYYVNAQNTRYKQNITQYF